LNTIFASIDYLYTKSFSIRAISGYIISKNL
jgi:hypothetical protein